MIKKILIGTLLLVVTAAVVTSLYNTILVPAMQVEAAQAAGQGNETAWQAGSETPAQPQTVQPSQPDAAVVPNGPDRATTTGTNLAQGNVYRYGGQNQAATGTGDPQPQNGLTEWLTFQGTVTDLEAPFFNLVLSDGQVIPAELGSQAYLSQLGLAVQNGDLITVTGFWDANGSLTAGQITLADGQTFSLRDELGRPSWRGGPGKGGQGSGRSNP